MLAPPKSQRFFCFVSDYGIGRAHSIFTVNKRIVYEMQTYGRRNSNGQNANFYSFIYHFVVDFVFSFSSLSWKTFLITLNVAVNNICRRTDSIAEPVENYEVKIRREIFFEKLKKWNSNIPSVLRWKHKRMYNCTLINERLRLWHCQSLPKRIWRRHRRLSIICLSVSILMMKSLKQISNAVQRRDKPCYMVTTAIATAAVVAAKCDNVLSF